MADSGGLWRMGHEFPGSGLIGGLPVRVDAVAVGDGITRLDSSVAAADGTTILLPLPSPEPVDHLRTGVTGGWIDRPAHREQTPASRVAGWRVRGLARVDARGHGITDPTTAASDAGVTWHAERPGWWTWAWQLGR